MKARNQTEPTAQKTRLTFGLNSTKCQWQPKELMPFEDWKKKKIKNLRFQKVDNKLQRMLAKDLKDIQSIIIPNVNCSRQNIKYVLT